MKRKFFVLIMLCFCYGSLFPQSYRIGDLYTAPDGSQGIVYYLHPDGSGGWVVALNDASTGCAWGDASDVPGLANQNPTYSYYLLYDTAGYINTSVLRNYQNSSGYAAGVVDFAHGWYLPSPAQLRMLYAKLPFIDTAFAAHGGTTMANSWYWTSAEQDASNAWGVRFMTTGTGAGYFLSDPKSSQYRVRAVRSFDNLIYSWESGEQSADISITPSQSDIYRVIVTTVGGCKDTAEHTVVVKESSNVEISQTACDSYEWNGRTFYESGDITYNYQKVNGCDSLVTLHLTVEKTPTVTIVSEADAVCAGRSVVLQAQTGVQHVYVGDILCTDNSIVRPSEWPVEGKEAMGIVFYVDSTDKHGWAVHLQDQNTSVRWGGNGTNIPTMTNYVEAYEAIMDLDGYSNTQNIRNTGNASTFPAAYAVDFEHGWYLPAAGQLRLLYAEIVTINASLLMVNGTQFSMNEGWYYWSSTESADNYDSWCVYIYGHVLRAGRTHTYAVRSVRTF